LLLVIIQD